MAFMMPVMKNEFDIYNGGRSRKVSECSNASSCRSRKVSESRSEYQNFSTSPPNDYSPAHRNQISRSYSKPFSRNSSRTSQNSFTTSPTRTYSQPSTSPPKSATNNGSQGSLNKFHTRLVDKLRKSFRKDTSERS